MRTRGREECGAIDRCDGTYPRARTQFVWPCPREYPEDAQIRESQKWLIPADRTKEQTGLLFKQVVTKFGLGPNLVKIHVFDEPHKKYNRATGVRERHKHIIFKMKTPFAHLQIQKALAAKGVYGHFSFNLVGYVKYLAYCMVPSASLIRLLASLVHIRGCFPHLLASIASSVFSVHIWSSSGKASSA